MGDGPFREPAEERTTERRPVLRSPWWAVAALAVAWTIVTNGWALYAVTGGSCAVSFLGIVLAAGPGTDDRWALAAGGALFSAGGLWALLLAAPEDWWLRAVPVAAAILGPSLHFYWRHRSELH